MNKLLRVGCILIAVFFSFCLIALLPQPVSAQTLTASIPIGNGSYGVAFTPNGEYAYVTNQNSGTVSVISTASNTVVATVNLGSLPNAVTVTPDGQYAYITNVGNNTVSVINTATNMLTATVTVGNDPTGVAVTPNGKYVYVANDDALSDNNSVSVISTATNTVAATISIGKSTSSVALTPDVKHAYVTSYGYNGLLSVISTATNTVTTTIPVGLWPLSVTISPNGRYAYVTHDISVADYISVVNTSTNKETENITVGGNDTEYVAFTPNSEYAYVTVLPAPPNTPGPGPLGNGSVSIINTATNKMASSLPLLGEPIGLAISPNGTYAYVTTMKNGQNGALLEISIPAAEQTATTQNPAVPELSFLAILTLLLSVLSAAVIVRYRKSNCSKR